MKKLIFRFNNLKSQSSFNSKNILGGKGANLAQMTKLGLPVPPGFTISTKACEYFYKNKKKIPKKIVKESKKEINIIEKTIIGISLKTDPVNDGSSNSRLESGDSVVIDAFVTYKASQETEMTTAQYSDATWTLEPASSDQFEWNDDTRELKSFASTSESRVIIQAAWKEYEKEITVYLGQ